MDDVGAHIVQETLVMGHHQQGLLPLLEVAGGRSKTGVTMPAKGRIKSGVTMAAKGRIKSGVTMAAKGRIVRCDNGS